MNDQWMYVGCFAANPDGTSHGDPWSDGEAWKDDTWEVCITRRAHEYFPAHRASVNTVHLSRRAAATARSARTPACS
jgi:hypothetical protein